MLQRPCLFPVAGIPREEVFGHVSPPNMTAVFSTRGIYLPQVLRSTSSGCPNILPSPTPTFFYHPTLLPFRPDSVGHADRPADHVPGSLGKRIKAALLCKTLPKDDNPAKYVNGSSSSPSRNLVTAIKLAGYVVHCGTGGKVSAVDGDGREVRDERRERTRGCLSCVGSKHHVLVVVLVSEGVLERERELSRGLCSSITTAP